MWLPCTACWSMPLLSPQCVSGLYALIGLFGFCFVGVVYPKQRMHGSTYMLGCSTCPGAGAGVLVLLLRQPPAKVHSTSMVCGVWECVGVLRIVVAAASAAPCRHLVIHVVSVTIQRVTCMDSHTPESMNSWIRTEQARQPAQGCYHSCTVLQGACCWADALLLASWLLTAVSLDQQQCMPGHTE